MTRTYAYRMNGSQAALAQLDRQLYLCRQVYNACLEQRRTAHQMGLRVGLKEQSAELPGLKEALPELQQINSQVLQGVTEKLERSYQAFFAGLKAKRRVGPPRFQNKDRFNSITFKQTGWKLAGNRLTLAKIGSFKLRLSRAIIGTIKTVTIKTVTIKRDRCGRWYVYFACADVPTTPLPTVGRELGIDLGLKSYLTDSGGEEVANPRHLRAVEQKLARRQRELARKKKGSGHRAACKLLVAKLHAKVAASRRDFQFKTALMLCRKADVIVAEKLNVLGLSRGRLARSVNDAGWGQFVGIMQSQAEKYGRSVVLVNPAHTTQACSACGQIVKKALADRWHLCDCGCSLDRDHNAALNILTVGQTVSGESVRLASVSSSL